MSANNAEIQCLECVVSFDASSVVGGIMLGWISIMWRLRVEVWSDDQQTRRTTVDR